MHKLSYHDKKGIQANIAHALMAMGGWTIFGYHADASDSMTDYYQPARWDGIAQKGDVVLVIDASGYDAKNSGKEITEYKMLPGPCSPCKGTGLTQYDRDEYVTRTVILGTVTVHKGMTKGTPCDNCNGTGQRDEMRERGTGKFWPTFTANQGRTKWHVEKAGKIVLSGSTMYAPLARYERWGHGDNPAPQIAAAQKWIESILERAGGMKAARTTSVPASVDAVTVRPGKREGFVEVVFPSKPDAATRESLKSAGFRWAKFDGCWYGRESALPAEFKPAAQETAV